MTNKCYFCSGELKNEKVDIARYWGNKLIALKNVPAIICKKCGERYFEAKVSAEIDQKINKCLGQKNLTEKISVPVLHF